MNEWKICELVIKMFLNYKSNNSLLQIKQFEHSVLTNIHYLN